MLPASLLDGSSLDLSPSLEDARAASEVDVGGCEVVEAFVIAAMIVVVDEVGDGPLEIAGEKVVLEQDPALQ